MTKQGYPRSGFVRKWLELGRAETMRLFLVFALSLFGLAQIQAQAFQGPPNPSNSKPPIKFLSLNLLYCDPLSRETRQQYDTRLAKTIAKIKALSPDLMAFQEVANCKMPGGDQWVEMAKTIAAQTGFSYSFWKSEEARGIWVEGIAFFWNPKTVQFDSVVCQHLGGTYYKGPMKITKSLCRGNLRTAENRVIRFYNTHLDTDERYSCPQAQEILSVIAQEARSVDSVIWAGDFNNRPETRAIATIKESGFQQLAYDRVDFIFGRNLKNGTYARVINFVQDGLSDHNGLWLELY